MVEKDLTSRPGMRILCTLEPDARKLDVGTLRRQDAGVASGAAAFADPLINVSTYLRCHENECHVIAGRIPFLQYSDIEMALLVEGDLVALRPELPAWVDPDSDPEVVPKRDVTSSTEHLDPLADGRVAVDG